MAYIIYTFRLNISNIGEVSIIGTYRGIWIASFSVDNSGDVTIVRNSSLEISLSLEFVFSF